jgi:hypothetical protein
LLLNQGCAGLQINMPPFNGKFEHCARAAAAGEGAKSALLEQGLSEDLASTTGKKVEEAVVDALNRGETPEKVAEVAVAAVTRVAREVSASSPPQSNDGDAANAVFAAAGAAAAAAAASNSVESAAPAAKAAAETAVRGEDEQAAKQRALEAGLPENVANVAGTAAEIGVQKAQQAVKGGGAQPEPGAVGNTSSR